MMRNGQALDNLLSRAQLQVKAVESLGQVLAAEKESLRRLHWATQLDAIRDRVKREVEAERSRESAERSGFRERKFVGALVAFGVGVYKANTGRVNEEPFTAGVRQSKDYLQKTAPFGTVMVSVGSRGLFGDVRVVSISRIAREQWRPESDVIATIKAKGSGLLTPDAFFCLIEDQRQKLLIGPTEASSMLPAPGRPRNEPAEHRQPKD
jgi:hypothetical protein